jgi:hypothetical protein
MLMFCNGNKSDQAVLPVTVARNLKAYRPSTASLLKADMRYRRNGMHTPSYTTKDNVYIFRRTPFRTS